MIGAYSAEISSSVVGFSPYHVNASPAFNHWCISGKSARVRGRKVMFGMVVISWSHFPKLKHGANLAEASPTLSTVARKSQARAQSRRDFGGISPRFQPREVGYS